MTTTQLSPKSGGWTANDWFCELSADRPVDECPKCKQLGMQFYARIPDEPDQENVFRCCACVGNFELGRTKFLHYSTCVDETVSIKACSLAIPDLVALQS